MTTDDLPDEVRIQHSRGPSAGKYGERVGVHRTRVMDGLSLWGSYGIEAEVARRWVAVLRRHAMPSTTQEFGPSAWPGKDWAVVTSCLIGDYEPSNPDAGRVLGWLSSRIPIDRAEHYLPAGLSLNEALQHEAEGSYDQQSLSVMAALRTGLTGGS